MSPQIYIAFGTILAALIAGLFAYVNLISAKENKVSEFRLEWINGLREEIAAYTAATQEIARVEGVRKSLFASENLSDEPPEIREREWLKETRDPYMAVVSTLSKIQLRLNPAHVAENPSGPEAKLMNALYAARDAFNNEEYEKATECSRAIRSAAAPLLKSTWNDVKNGEPRYQEARRIAQEAITTGFGIWATALIVTLVFNAVSQHS